MTVPIYMSTSNMTAFFPMSFLNMLWSEVKLLSCVRLFVTPWTIAHQALPSMGFSRQEYWSGLPFPSPGDLPNPGIKPGSPALQADALTTELPGFLIFANLEGEKWKGEKLAVLSFIFPFIKEIKQHVMYFLTIVSSINYHFPTLPIFLPSSPSHSLCININPLLYTLDMFLFKIYLYTWK